MADVFTGVCVGGPLDGSDVTVRSEVGFLAADKQAGLAWLYKRRPDGRFAVCLDHDDSLVYEGGRTDGTRTLDKVRLWDAGFKSVIDVIAVDTSGG